ncbi:DUF924 family protein [Litoribacillus peritrichatus]|uniref:DUF924 family protein n=1 Tax=Litoribacillus peritrichatus TaxID=718191 RepID=A0ABP7MYW0_9GAMM
MSPMKQVINYWFGTLDEDGFAHQEEKQKWWSASDEIDLEISHKFGDLVKQALNHQLKDWRESTTGKLASIILLDQFTRNIYRGTEQAFSGDNKALKICKMGLSSGEDLDLTAEQQVFFYMPLEHSEDLEDQELCIRLLEGLKKRSPHHKEETIDGYIRFAKHHRDIIAEFGRFPHRNKVLQRKNTPEEERYLDGEHTSFGQ